MYQDWFKVWRKITKSKVFANPHILKLWILCLKKANWTDKVILWDGAVDTIEVKRGQFVTGRESLHAEYYKVSRGSRKTSRTTWRWLKTLESWQCLRLESVQGVTLVTLCNYQTYNDGEKNVSNLLTTECPDDVQTMSKPCPDDVQTMSTEEEGLDSSKNNQEPEEGEEEGDTIQDVADAWAKTPGTRPIRKLTPSRIKTGKTRLFEKDWLWRDALAKFPLRCFADGDWIPTLDWFLRPGKVTEILEENYDWSKGNGKPTKSDENLAGAAEWLRQKQEQRDAGS